MSIREVTVVDWPQRCAELEARREELAADELDEWGQGLWFLGREDESARAWEQAHVAHLDAGDLAAAVRCAFWLGLTLAEQGHAVRANTWMSRVVALSAEGDTPALIATRALCLGLGAHAAGDAAGAVPHLRAARQAAQTDGADPALRDLAVLAAMALGRALVETGAFEEGFGLLDEVMLMIGSGQATDRAAGPAYCAVIASLVARWDLERARVWTRDLGDWCDSQRGLVPFRGDCALHRATVLCVGGEWEAAAETVQTVCDTETRRETLADAWYLLGDLHRLRGRPAEAEAAYGRSAECGRDPQPGLALTHADLGDRATARTGLTRALQEPRAPAHRADLLAATARFALDDGDLSAAAASTTELEHLADAFGTGCLQAMALTARGELTFAEGRHADALATLRAAWSAWQRVGAPYAAACTRIAMGRACRALRDDAGAQLEFDAARHVLESLGAVPALARLERAATTAAPSPAAVLSPREREVIVLIARGWSNRRIAEHLFLSERTVARHVSNILAKVGAANQAGATAFAFAQGLATPG